MKHPNFAEALASAVLDGSIFEPRIMASSQRLLHVYESDPLAHVRAAVMQSGHIWPVNFETFPPYYSEVLQVITEDGLTAAQIHEKLQSLSPPPSINQIKKALKVAIEAHALERIKCREGKAVYKVLVW